MRRPKVLDELVRAFPLSAEAPAALLRLGENGIHKDNPTVDELFAVYEAPNPRLRGCIINVSSKNTRSRPNS